MCDLETIASPSIFNVRLSDDDPVSALAIIVVYYESPDTIK